MFESLISFFKKLGKKEKGKSKESSDTAKERLHLVLMQDRANVSADFLELMKQEIIEVIKKYIDVDEKAIDVRLTNKSNEDGTVGAPALYANIPIMTIKNEARQANAPQPKKEDKLEESNSASERLDKNSSQPVAEKQEKSKQEVLEKENKETNKRECLEETQKVVSEEQSEEKVDENKLKEVEKPEERKEKENAEKIQGENLEEKTEGEESKQKSESEKEVEIENKKTDETAQIPKEEEKKEETANA